jgi:sugar lactone lactonase YvrE
MSVRSFEGVTLVPLGGPGPEDVLIDEQGRVYAGLNDGRIVRVAGPGAPVETVARVPGRPLGLEFLGDGELLVCASQAGLLAVSLQTQRVRTLTDQVDGRPLQAVNNAAVADDGSIYFTDSSQRYRVPQWRADIVQRTRSGRLFRRAPEGTVTELLGGLEFANGVALAHDQSYVAVAETGACRLHRVWLRGERAGTSEIFVDPLTGYPDNIALGSDGLIWVAVASPKAPQLAKVQALPGPVRTLVTKVPPRLQPKGDRTVSVVAVDDDGQVVHEFSGEIGGFWFLTAVRERDGRLWLGSLEGSSIATLDTTVAG